MFALMNQYKLEINTTPAAGTGAETWARLGAGISGAEPATNDEIDQTTYLDGNGWGSSDVTGAQLTYAVSGHRKIGDAAQDFIYSPNVQYGLGEDRKTQARVTDPQGNTVTGPVTIANIEGPSGDANAKAEIAFELHFNGKPVYAAAPTPV